MTAIERYRLFKKDGSYDVGVGRSRHEAIAYYKQHGGNMQNVLAIALIKGNGNQRTFILQEKEFNQLVHKQNPPRCVVCGTTKDLYPDNKRHGKQYCDECYRKGEVKLP